MCVTRRAKLQLVSEIGSALNKHVARSIQAGWVSQSRFFKGSLCTCSHNHMCSLPDPLLDSFLSRDFLPYNRTVGYRRIHVGSSRPRMEFGSSPLHKPNFLLSLFISFFSYWQTKNTHSTPVDKNLFRLLSSPWISPSPPAVFWPSCFLSRFIFLLLMRTLNSSVLCINSCSIPTSTAALLAKGRASVDSATLTLIPWEEQTPTVIG